MKRISKTVPGLRKQILSMHYMRAFFFALGTSLSLAGCGGLPKAGERTVSTAMKDTGRTPLAAVVRPKLAAHPGQSGLHALADAHDALAARLALADAAQRSLDVQYYINTAAALVGETPGTGQQLPPEVESSNNTYNGTPESGGRETRSPKFDSRNRKGVDAADSSCYTLRVTCKTEDFHRIMADIAHEDIVPVTAFIRNYKSHLERIRATGRPGFLAIDGVPMLAVITMDAYARFAEAREYLDSVQDIRASIEDIAAGRVHDADVVHEEMRSL